MYCAPSFQNIKLTKAGTFSDLPSTPFFIKFNSTGDDSYGEVCFHLENAALAEALVKAFNDTLAEFEPTKPFVDGAGDRPERKFR